MGLPQSQLVDGNGRTVPMELWDALNHLFTIAKSTPGIADSSNPAALYASQYMALDPLYATGLPVNVPKIIQTASAKSTGNVASISASFTNPTGNGNSIVALVGNGNNGTLSVADTQSLTYTSEGSIANSTTFEGQIFLAVNTALNAADTITATNAGTAASMTLTIYEISGILEQVTAQPDQSATNTGTGTTASTAAMIPTVPNSIFFGLVVIGTAAQTITPASGWSNDSGQLNPTTPSGLYSSVAMSQFRGSIGSVSPSATIGSSEPWAMIVVNFRPVALSIEGKVNIAVGGTMAALPADSEAVANTVPATQMVQTGTALVSPRRVITKFIQLQAQSITHATPVDVYTPTSGKKWRILGYNISTTVAGAIQFEDTTGNEVLRTPLLLAAAPFASGDMGNGLLSAAANNHLFLDVTVTGAVTGWIGIEEE